MCHYENDFGIQQNVLNIGKFFEGWNDKFYFYYDEQEEDIATDYLANDKGWFVVSNKLKDLLESMNTRIQFLPVRIIEKNSKQELEEYYIVNVLNVVDALCLEKSDYFETEIPGMGTIYTVSKYGIFGEKTEGLDIFKLSNRQEIPIFASERFSELITSNSITGISLREIDVK